MTTCLPDFIAPQWRSAKPAVWPGVWVCLGIIVLLCSGSGCRSIGSGAESRQSIAARRLSRQGLEAMHHGNWKDAEELFAGALDLNDADDRANWGMAETLWRRGEREKAVQFMNSAVRQSGSHPELLVRLGRMHFEQGNFADANARCVEALQVGRELPGTWALHGDCLQQQGRSDAALAAYHRALALQPDFPEVQVQAAELYRQQGRYDRLLATLDRLRDSTGDATCPARVHMLRGIAMRQLGRPNEAAECFALVARLTPDDPDAHLQIASLALESREYEAARLATLAALELDPQSSLGKELGAQIEQSVRLATEGPDATAKR